MSTGNGEITEQQGRKPSKNSSVSGVGEQTVGPIGTVVLAIFMIAIVAILVYSLIKFWIELPINGANAPPIEINYFGTELKPSYESILLVIVVICGALGSMVHTLRSMSWYIGNRDLRRSWIAKYIVQPFIGAALALIFYFVVRAGFFSAQATVESTSLLGFAAMSGLVGMFSDQAVVKLKEVAETLLTRPKPGSNAIPQETEAKPLEKTPEV